MKTDYVSADVLSRKSIAVVSRDPVKEISCCCKGYRCPGELAHYQHQQPFHSCFDGTLSIEAGSGTEVAAMLDMNFRLQAFAPLAFAEETERPGVDMKYHSFPFDMIAGRSAGLEAMDVLHFPDIQSVSHNCG